MTKTKDSLEEEKKKQSLLQNSKDSRYSKTGYMEAGNEQKFKRRG